MWLERHWFAHEVQRLCALWMRTVRMHLVLWYLFYYHYMRFVGSPRSIVSWSPLKKLIVSKHVRRLCCFKIDMIIILPQICKMKWECLLHGNCKVPPFKIQLWTPNLYLTTLKPFKYRSHLRTLPSRQVCRCYHLYYTKETSINPVQRRLFVVYFPVPDSD